MRKALGRVALLALLISGCSGLRPEANPEGPSWKNHSAWALRLHYQKELVAPSRSVGEPYERGEPEIDVLGRRVFVVEKALKVILFPWLLFANLI